jgi:hypothetical protein
MVIVDGLAADRATPSNVLVNNSWNFVFAQLVHLRDVVLGRMGNLPFTFTLIKSSALVTQFMLLSAFNVSLQINLDRKEGCV